MIGNDTHAYTTVSGILLVRTPATNFHTWMISLYMKINMLRKIIGGGGDKSRNAMYNNG